jgi:membrane protein YqaA with SNARE-associated domain
MSSATDPRPGWFRRLYDALLQWSASPHGLAVLALVSFAEASFFPIPPDVLIIAAVLAHPKVWWKAVAVCSIASIAGGMTGYLIGRGLWGAVSGFFFDWVPGFTPEVYDRVSGLYEQWNFWIVFGAGFTPIPYKVFTIAAGVAKINVPVFLLASAVSRTARFALVAGALRLCGPKIKPILDKYLAWITLLFFILLIGGFVLVSWLAKH